MVTRGDPRRLDSVPEQGVRFPLARDLRPGPETDARKRARMEISCGASEVDDLFQIPRYQSASQDLKDNDAMRAYYASVPATP